MRAAGEIEGLRTIGRVSSPLTDRAAAPKQGDEGDLSRSATGVFATRSPDRPNPIGLHRVRVVGIQGAALRVEDLEAIDGTPVLDLKPVLGEVGER